MSLTSQSTHEYQASPAVQAARPRPTSAQPSRSSGRRTARENTTRAPAAITARCTGLTGPVGSQGATVAWASHTTSHANVNHNTRRSSLTGDQDRHPDRRA